MISVMFESATQDWSTPRELFRWLDDCFHFSLDPCASLLGERLCPKTFTALDDGLAQSWAGHRVFVNPPYGRAIKEWVRKAVAESRHDATTVVCLVPARTDTAWWEECISHARYVIFLRGRLRFARNGSDRPGTAPFPSAIIVLSQRADVAIPPNLRTVCCFWR